MERRRTLLLVPLLVLRSVIGSAQGQQPVDGASSPGFVLDQPNQIAPQQKERFQQVDDEHERW